MKYKQLEKKRLVLQKSHIHGWGLYTEELIHANDFVLEYVGEIIHRQVAKRRYARCGIGGGHFLFRVEYDTIIDSTKKGNKARFINHCCAPNCSVKVIVVDNQKKVVIYAIRDIEPGEEITYDYRTSIELNQFHCLCGSKFCKGMIK
ncbi:histone methyltransferase [Cokeromyces recurvatus]|uniref:histone methyltransferase n=1 Tax=Cokeromyces recurvatus TaxID=90255 RepID=UPI00221FF80C|nr:histone methyltransferase [Cokeromyces recurvatus]KAI7903606.1 histone methyltransferase [Cokeromyces recurvatus]